jgi:hypothetical protein
MIRTAVFVIAAASIVACQSGAPQVAGADAGTKIPACTWPATADTFDSSSSTGCLPRSMFQICEVPEGSVVHADGTISTPEGTTVNCEDPCTPSEYSLSCAGPLEFSSHPEIPTPAPSLGCRVIPIPTPSNELFYCCPCAQ